MKKKFKFGILVALVLALCAFVFAACAGNGGNNNGDNNTVPGVIDTDVPGYDHNRKAAFGELPDEKVLVDGKLDEDMWQGLDYYEHADTDRPGLSYKVTTHFSKKGLYVGAVSTDNRVAWGAKNYFWNNRNTQFRINIAAPSVTTFSTSNVKEILIDSNNVYPGNVRLNAKSAVLGGEVNSDNTKGLSVEMFITWQELGINVEQKDENGDTKIVLPDYVQMYVRYVYVVRGSGSLSDGTFSINPGIMYDYARYGKDGYLAIDRDGAVVGDTADGHAKSAGWDISGEPDGSVKSINTQWQGIFFKQNAATNFVVSTKIKPMGRLTTNIGPKAGLFTYTNNIYYRAITIDTDNANVSGSKVLTDKMFAITHYPNNAYDLTPLTDGSAIEYPSGQNYVDLKLIKKGSTFYYVVNGKLTYAESQPYMGGAVYAGLYSLYGAHVFSDYSYTNYDNNVAGIDAEIAKYAYMVDVPSSSAYKGGVVSTDKIAVAKDATDKNVTLSFTARSGYRLTDIKDNGVSVFDEYVANAVGNEIVVPVVDKDLKITAEFTEIGDDEKVVLSGRLSAKDNTLLDSAKIEIQALTPTGAVVPFYTMNENATTRAEYYLTLTKGYKYRLTINRVGCRKLVHTTDVLSNDVTKYDLVAENNVVGGIVNNVNGVSVTSNPDAWDLSREEESIARIHANTPNGNTVYFTGKADTRLVAETTIVNVTDSKIYSDYEKDPAAGFRFTDGNNAIFIGLWQSGLRILPTMGEWSPIGVTGVVAENTVNVIDKPCKLKVIRVDNQFYCYIDCSKYNKDTNSYEFTGYKHVYTYMTNVFNSYGGATATAVGFTFTTSFPLTMDFTNYRLDTGAAAESEIRANVYSKINVTGTGVTFGGIDSTGYAAQGAELTASASVAAGEAYIIRVNGANGASNSYLINSASTSVTIKVPDSDTTDIVVEKAAVVKTVSGTVKTADNKPVSKATAKLEFDEGKGSVPVAIGSDGRISANLPAGGYKLTVTLGGYNSTAVEFEVTDSAVDLGDVMLVRGVIGGSTIVNRVNYSSRTTCFNEENGKWHATNDSASNSTLYFNDFAGEEYAATIKTRISTRNGNPYFANDYVQGFTVVDGARVLHIAMIDGAADGFRVMYGGWNTDNMIETEGSGWAFVRDDMNNANGYVDIVMSLVRRGNALYLFVGSETAGATRDMKLYLIVSATDGVVPVSVNGANHRIKSGTLSRVNAMNALLKQTLATGMKNGLGYTIHMNTSAPAGKINHSMIYDAVLRTDAASIDAGLSMNITEAIGSGGTVTYSGEGYYEIDGVKRYGFGKNITITATPDADMCVKSFKVNGKEVSYTLSGDVATATVSTSGVLSVEIEFTEKTYAATITGMGAGAFSNLNKVTATDGSKTIEVTFEKSATGRIVTVYLPKGTWTVSLLNGSSVLATANVTINGTETETPSVKIN